MSRSALVTWVKPFSGLSVASIDIGKCAHLKPQIKTFYPSDSAGLDFSLFLSSRFLVPEVWWQVGKVLTVKVLESFFPVRPFLWWLKLFLEVELYIFTLFKCLSFLSLFFNTVKFHLIPFKISVPITPHHKAWCLALKKISIQLISFIWGKKSFCCDCSCLD